VTDDDVIGDCTAGSRCTNRRLMANIDVNLTLGGRS